MPKGKRNLDGPTSDVDGVTWNKTRKQWRGDIFNKLTKKHEQTVPSYITDKNECEAATIALRQRLDNEFLIHLTKLSEDDPLTRGLPHAPKDAANGEGRIVYWHAARYTGYKPYRAVKVKNGSKFQWHPACQHRPDPQQQGCAVTAIDKEAGAPLIFCGPHGGYCSHGRPWRRCRVHNPTNITKNMGNCSSCGVILYVKRQESNGGNGLCSGCETHFKNEAAESGGEPPAKGKRWEDLVLDELETLVTDRQGNVIKCEMRDDMKNMLGSNKRRKVGECSTDHQRRPDILWLVRDEELRIVAAITVEVDEHSHSDRESDCEAGKIDETFQAILKLAQEEGKGRLAETRKGKIYTPYVLFLKFNPNACDAPGGSIPLSTRIKMLAQFVNGFMNAGADHFKTLADNGRCLMPHVQCLYYHTKQGGKHLAYFEKHAEGAWDYQPNFCPRSGEEHSRPMVEVEVKEGKAGPSGTSPMVED